MKNWYAIYTRPRFEKKVAEELAKQNIDHYLPLIRVLKQWSDRKKWVREPLFRSYVFVYIEEGNYLPVQKTHGVARFITFEKEKVKIPPNQIEAVKNYVDSGDYMDEKAEDFEIGGRVQIISGSMKGIEGRLIKRSSKHKVRIEIEAIHHFIYLNIPMSHLKPIR